MIKKINKKAQNDLIAIVITLFTVAFLGLIVILVIQNVSPKLLEFVPGESVAHDAIEDSGNVFVNGLDNLFLGIFVILIIGMVILSIFIDSSPIFIPIYLIIAVIATWFSAVISNVYMMSEATGLFNTVIDFLPKQTFIMENLPYFTAGIAFLLLVVTYSKGFILGRQNYQ